MALWGGHLVEILHPRGPWANRGGQMKIAIVLLAACTALAGCAATTGVVAVGGENYMVSHRDNGPMSSLGALKASAY